MKKLLKAKNYKKGVTLKINSTDYIEFNKVLKKNFAPNERNKFSFCQACYEFFFYSQKELHATEECLIITPGYYRDINSFFQLYRQIYEIDDEKENKILFHIRE